MLDTITIIVIINIIIQKMQKNIFEANIYHSSYKHIKYITQCFCILSILPCTQHVLSFEDKAENIYEFTTLGSSVKHQDIRFSQ